LQALVEDRQRKAANLKKTVQGVALNMVAWLLALALSAVAGVRFSRQLWVARRPPPGPPAARAWQRCAAGGAAWEPLPQPWRWARHAAAPRASPARPSSSTLSPPLTATATTHSCRISGNTCDSPQMALVHRLQPGFEEHFGLLAGLLGSLGLALWVAAKLMWRLLPVLTKRDVKRLQVGGCGKWVGGGVGQVGGCGQLCQLGQGGSYNCMAQGQGCAPDTPACTPSASHHLPHPPRT
jgi:hypothetical protein